MKKRVKIQWFVYALVFALFLYIGYKVPYCHDEWRWGTDARFQLMKEGLLVIMDDILATFWQF